MKIREIVFIFIIIIIVQSNAYYTNAYAIGIEARDQEGKLVYSGGNPHNQNRFEIGTLGLPVIISYALLSLVGILFFKKKSNKLISKILNALLNFEISKKISFFIVVGLLSIYIITNVSKIWNPDEVSLGDYPVLLKGLEEWTFSDQFQSKALFLPFLRWDFLAFSHYVLGNVRIIPFLESISLVTLTYFLTVDITRKRFSGVIAIAILIQSHLFLRYSVAATEDNLWILFFVLSIYLVLKKWYASPISYFLSFVSKGLVVLFIPMIVFFTYKSIIPKNEKIRIYISYLFISIVLVVAIFLHQTHVSSINFDVDKFVNGFKISSSWLRSDVIVSLFLLPLIVGLGIKARNGIIHADSIMFLILGTVMSAPLLISVTDFTNQPYRFIPVIVFFAIGIGMLFSNDYVIVNKKTRRISFIIFSILFIIILLSTISIIFPALIQTSDIS